MIVVVFRYEAFDFAIPAVVELKEREDFFESSGIEGAKFVGLVCYINFSNGVLPELVVEVYIPAQ